MSLTPVSGSAEEILALLRDWEDADDPAPLVIETSGSSGAPKRVVLARAAMRASARATEKRLGGPGQWVLNLPPTYVAGVQVLFRSVLAGTTPVVTNDLSLAVEQMTGRRYVSLVPTQLHRLLDDASQLAALSELDAVLVGGGPSRAEDIARAEAAGVNAVRTYGMSETCGGCVYDGVALDGVQVRLDGDRVLLRGPMLFDGYEGEPDRTAAAFEDGWLVTHDLGRVVDGRLEIVGRDDDVIISGGVKVPAQAVAAMLREHPAVTDAHVFAIPDPEWGEQVVAVVAAPPLPLAELRDKVEPRSWAPHRVAFVEALPLLPNGKVDRQRTRDLL